MPRSGSCGIGHDRKIRATPLLEVLYSRRTWAPSGPPAYAHIPMGLISSIDSRDYCPGPQRCLQASCWLVQLRLQAAPLLPAPAGFASVAAVGRNAGILAVHGQRIAIDRAVCESRSR